MFLDLWRGKHWSVKSIDINWNWLDTHCSAPPSPFSKIGKLTNSAWTFSMFYLMTLGVLGLAKTCTRPPNNLDCDTSTRFPNQCQGLPAIKFSSPPTSHIDKCDQKFTKAAISRHCLCFIIKRPGHQIPEVLQWCYIWKKITMSDFPE